MDIRFVEGATKSEIQADSLENLYTLSFTYKFLHDYDTVFFAHFKPYTYTDLQNYLCKLKADS
jgi:hypothetical protein